MESFHKWHRAVGAVPYVSCPKSHVGGGSRCISQCRQVQEIPLDVAAPVSGMFAVPVALSVEGYACEQGACFFGANGAMGSSWKTKAVSMISWASLLIRRSMCWLWCARDVTGYASCDIRLVDELGLPRSAPVGPLLCAILPRRDQMGSGPTAADPMLVSMWLCLAFLQWPSASILASRRRWPPPLQLSLQLGILGE